MNSTVSFANSCSTNYVQGSNAILLRNDADNGWIGPATLGSATTLQNSQCSVNVGQSSASGSGNVLTVNLALSFKPGFAGAKNQYALVYDQGGNNSGFQQVGTWLPAPVNSAPAVVGVMPSSGSGTTQTFNFQYSSANGFGYITQSFQVMNSTVSFANSCSTNYVQGSNAILLRNDADNGWIGPATLGSATTLQNSQCSVNVGQSSASGSGNVLTVNLALSFKPGFAGAKNQYALVYDQGGNNSGFQQVGAFTVP